MKNPHAVALGKKGKGIPKNYSPQERERRRQWTVELRRRLAEKRTTAQT